MVGVRVVAWVRFRFRALTRHSNGGVVLDIVSFTPSQVRVRVMVWVRIGVMFMIRVRV